MGTRECQLLIVGASVRWLMQSARRAGLQVTGIDFFGDADATEAGEVWQVEQWSEVPALAARLKPGAILCGSGFETQPVMVEALRRLGPLWNLTAAQADACRDPRVWPAALAAAGLSLPRHLFAGERVLPEGGSKRWLVKQRFKAGGNGVRQLEASELAQHLDSGAGWSEGEYLQERLVGWPSSALFLLQAAGPVCLGFFRQLCGRVEFGARGYQYCGGIGPLPVAAVQRAQLGALGQVLWSLGGRGVVGVDLIVAGDKLVPVEINPRLTATGELWERVVPDESLVGLTGAEFDGGPGGLWMRSRGAGLPPTFDRGRAGLVGKAILYWSAKQPLLVEGPKWELLWRGAQAGCLADIPRCGSQIDNGKPVVTLFAEGPAEAQVLANLIAAAGELRAQLSG